MLHDRKFGLRAGSVVDDEVDWPQVTRYLCEARGDGVLVGHIELGQSRVPSLTSDRVHDRAGACRVASIVTATAQPSAASALDISTPRPREAPVTRATLISSLRWVSLRCRCSDSGSQGGSAAQKKCVIRFEEVEADAQRSPARDLREVWNKHAHRASGAGPGSADAFRRGDHRGVGCARSAIDTARSARPMNRQSMRRSRAMASMLSTPSASSIWATTTVSALEAARCCGILVRVYAAARDEPA